MQKLINLFKTSFKWQAGCLIGLTFILYATLITNINLWLDEIYSVLMAKDRFHDMWMLLLTEDSKPPLYYLYLKFILSLAPKTYEIAAAHFGSLILLIAAQVFAATAVRKDYGDKVALWLIILIALVPHSLWLAFEVRTYMLSSLLLMIAVVYGLRLIDKPKAFDFVKFGIVSVATLYTHYYCGILLMFLYGIILVFLIIDKKWKNYGNMFILTSFLVAVCFAPWLYVPLHTGSIISKVWYVNDWFVRYSWQFFTNPFQPEIIQSSFFIATTFASSVFSFLLLIGLTNMRQWKSKTQHLFFAAVGSFILTYALLLLLSYVMRPMVTARYLKIFTLVLYLAAAVTLTQIKHIGHAVIAVLVFGFGFSYADIKAVNFDEGYQNAIKEIREFIRNDVPLLVTDNSNLFCEYYLPEYKCLLIDNGKGEILRKTSVAKNLSDYDYIPTSSLFSISIYGRPVDADECNEYASLFRYGQDIGLCRFDKPETIINLLRSSLEAISGIVKYH